MVSSAIGTTVWTWTIAAVAFTAVTRIAQHGGDGLADGGDGLGIGRNCSPSSLTRFVRMVEREVPHSHTLNTAEGVGGAPSLAAKLPTVVRSDTVIGKVRRFDPFIMRLLAAHAVATTRCAPHNLTMRKPVSTGGCCTIADRPVLRGPMGLPRRMPSELTMAACGHALWPRKRTVLLCFGCALRSRRLQGIQRRAVQPQRISPARAQMSMLS
jgi:hypothetical protein